MEAWLDAPVANKLGHWFTAQRARRSDEVGQGMIEYALILVLIVLVVIVIVGVLGVRVNNLYSNVSKGLSNQALSRRVVAISCPEGAGL